MRVAFLTIGRYPTTVAHAGGDVRIWQDLASLKALGHEIHLVACDPRGELEAGIRAMCSSVTKLESHVPARYSLDWLLTRGFNPETLLMRMPDVHGLRSAVAIEIDRVRPDFVWAEEQLTGVLVPRGVPFILGHVDFYFRLMRVRSQFRTIRRPNTMTNAGLEKFEYELSRRALMTLVASETDAELFRRRGIAAQYIPVVGATLPPPDPKKFSSGRFFLFGKANTAMRAARHHLRTELWPALDDELRRDWHQVGDPPSKPGEDPSWQWMTERFTKVHGFISDLFGLFEPGDASMMPYPMDASGHAKYATCMGYGLVNIGYEAGFVQTPELVPEENCLAPKTTAGLVDAMRRFRSDAKLRRRLADASRATYEEKFSFEAKVPDFERMLAAAFTNRVRSAAS